MIDQRLKKLEEIEALRKEQVIDSTTMNEWLDWAVTELRKSLSVEQVLKEALVLYSNYDKETIRHMDTEWLEPSGVAVIKPLEAITNNKGHAPDGKHPSEIYQDKVFTYGPKHRPGKIARKALSEISKLKEKS